MTELIWGIDISNWNGNTTTQNIADWVAAGVQVDMIRASLENQRLYEISVQQFTMAKPIRVTLPYAWCYGNDIPEQVVTETIKMVDGLASEKKVVFDVEDIQNFIHAFALPQGQPVAVPRRFLATAQASVDAKKIGFSAISQQDAVTWLQRAFAETRNQGYEPCIYSAEWCWLPLTGNSTAFANEKWLVAQPDWIPDLSVYAAVGGVTELMGKQYSFTGTIPLNDPNAPQYDFSVYNVAKLVSQPTPPTPPDGGGPDIPNAFDRSKNARAFLAPLVPFIPSVANADAELDGLQQDLSYPGGPQ